MSNLSRFLEYRYHIDPEMEQEILYKSRISGRGAHRDYYSVNLYYTLDLYNFIAKHGDFRNIYAWKLLGLQGFYSNYINSNKPIGIWAKDEIAEAKNLDPLVLSSLSAIPLFSGNFLINKHMMGGFFTATKTLCFVTAVLSEESEPEIKTWSWIGLGVFTGLDMLSVFFETNAIKQRLEFLQGAILSKNLDIVVPIFAQLF